jgi:molybdate/tungstate transport system substrate-binding protein
MIIAYNKNSKYASEINSSNWYEILLRDDVIIGRSEPNADPCGYRTVFVFKLTQKLLNSEGLADKFLSKENTVIRPKEVDLLSLLETGNIDYLFIYKSVAQQHNLNYLSLDDKINLSNPEFEELYSTVSMKVAGKEPGAETEIIGSSILYSFTIPKNSPNKELALKFALFLVNPDKGGKILVKNGMKVVNWCDPQNQDNLPVELKNSLKQ